MICAAYEAAAAWGWRRGHGYSVAGHRPPGTVDPYPRITAITCLLGADPIETDLEDTVRDVGGRARVVPVSMVSAAKVVDTVRDEDRLRIRLGHAVSREWIEGYLDFCADLLSTWEIAEDDLRLSMSAPESNTTLAMTINQRYVTCAFHHGRKVIGLMLPPGAAIPPQLGTCMAKVRERLGTFAAWRDESLEEVPSFAYFEVDDPRELSPLRDEWLLAVLRETERTWKRSSYRTRNHIPAFHRAVVDKSYRSHILEGLEFGS